MASIDLSKIITVDLECYYSSDYTLSGTKHNTSSYVRDAQFKEHLWGIKVGEKPAKIYKPAEAKKFFAKTDWSKYALLAHNAAFDGFALSHHHKVVPRFYYDTLSMTRGLHNELSRASLDVVAKLYQIGEKSKTYLAPTKGIRDLPPDMFEALGDGCLLDVELCYAVFLKQVEIFPEKELDLIDLTIRMFCDSVLEINMDTARKALAEEMIERRSLIMKSGLDESELGKNKVFAEKLISLGVTPPVKVSLKTGHETYAFAQTDAEFIELCDHEDADVRRLVHGRLAAKSSMPETRAARMISAGEGGKLPVGYNYWGAKTGRWSGSNKLNLQNLPRVNPHEPKPSDGLRHCIIAPSNHSLVVVDSGQIEARVTAWLCGEHKLLDLFAAEPGEANKFGVRPDVYAHMAASIFGRKLDAVTKDERFIGKIAILGLGYSMGATKFGTTLSMGIMGPAVTLPASTCKKIVNLYRGTNKNIVAGWKTAQHLISDMSSGVAGTAFDGKVEYEGMTIWMPNGMGLHYPGIHNVPGTAEYKYKSFEVWKKIYGGLLVENIVQALSRTIVAHQMLDIQTYLKGLKLQTGEVARVSLMTHDEVVTTVPARLADTVLKKQLQIMQTAPEHFAGLPLAAEGDHDIYYCK